MSGARILPTGSFIVLQKTLNIPGLPASNKWTANGQPVLRERCVQYIARDAASYWLYMPAGAHKGWFEVPSINVQYCKCDPPIDVIEAVTSPTEGAKTGATLQPQTSDKPSAA